MLHVAPERDLFCCSFCKKLLIGFFMSRSHFSLWLQGQSKRVGPVGDLARDACGDKGTYGLSSLRGWVGYLKKRGACDGALYACEKAWREYKQLVGVKRHPKNS